MTIISNVIIYIGTAYYEKCLKEENSIVINNKKALRRGLVGSKSFGI